MPRKDLSQERTTQILDAFERCIVRRGLGGTSLEDIAIEAGVKRSILRHYVGNRDDLISAMALRYTEHYLADLNELAPTAHDCQRMKVLYSSLFPRPSDSASASVVVAEALIAAGDEYPEVGALMRKLVTRTVESVAAVLAAEHPDAKKSDVWDVSFGLVGLSFNHESLAQLSLPAKFRRAGLESARRLVRSLVQDDAT